MVDESNKGRDRKVLKLKSNVDFGKVLATKQAKIRQGVEIEIRGDAGGRAAPNPSASRSAHQAPRARQHTRVQQEEKRTLTDQELEARQRALAQANAFFEETQAQRVQQERASANQKSAQAELDSQIQRRKEEAKASEAAAKAEAESRARPAAPSGVRKSRPDTQRRVYTPHQQQRPRQRDGRRRMGGQEQQKNPAFEYRPRVAERASLKGKAPKKAAYIPPQNIVKDVDVTCEMTVKEVAMSIARKTQHVIAWLRDMGVKAGDKTVLDVETVAMVVEAMGHRATITVVTEDSLLRDIFGTHEYSRESRPPVVAIMGHVDHGKTTLVDALCKTRRATKEAGGITQDVRGYQTSLPDGGVMTLIDTPGHAAFKKIRARGAEIVDIVLLIVAADDGPQPQTLEALEYLKNQNLPFIVVITKIDKEENTQHVVNAMMQHSVIPEALGGEHIFVEISAATGKNLDELLQFVALKALDLGLTAAPKAPVRGVVLDSCITKGLGVVCHVLVQEGVLRTGDYVVVDKTGSKVRALRDVRDKTVKSAGASEVVALMGLPDVPRAGTSLVGVKSLNDVKTIVDFRCAQEEGGEKVSLRTFNWEKVEGDTRLPLIIKADAQGSVEALEHVLGALACEEWSTTIVRADVGAVTSSTLDFAQTSGAAIVAFNTTCERGVDVDAKRADISLFKSDVIYTIEKEVYAHLRSLRAPKYEYVSLGRGEIIQVFDIAKYGRVAGCQVLEGVMRRGMQARITRGGEELCMQKITSLYKEKDAMKEVVVGNNCGVFLEGFENFDVGDAVECVEVRQIFD